MEKSFPSVSVLKDERVGCYSVMTSMTVSKYLEFVQSAHTERGGIEGQREPLKTTTGIRIRKTMISDLRRGAVLPPVVLGVVVSEAIFKKIDMESFQYGDLQKLLKVISKENISIIDGMQRTTALLECEDETRLMRRSMRVEFWITLTTNSLIYRMLVLNTGQVPWNLRRQIEVVFKPLIQEVAGKVKNIDCFEVDDGKRRSRGGQFHANQLVELYLVFGARKEKVDTKERLADEFTRLDFIEATADSRFTESFCESLRFLVGFDVAFDRYQPVKSTGRFSRGLDLFNSQPACVGFVTAVSLKVLGRPGSENDEKEQVEQMTHIKKNAESLLQKLKGMSEHEIGEFLDFATLNELADRKAGKVGDFEREFFLKAFQVLIDEGFKVKSMTPCWRAY